MYPAPMMMHRGLPVAKGDMATIVGTTTVDFSFEPGSLLVTMHI